MATCLRPLSTRSTPMFARLGITVLVATALAVPLATVELGRFIAEAQAEYRTYLLQKARADRQTGEAIVATFQGAGQAVADAVAARTAADPLWARRRLGPAPVRMPLR